MTTKQSVINRRVLTVAWPILLEVTLASLFGMVNMVVLGKYDQGTYSAQINVAAVGLINSPINLALTIVQALGVGGTTLIARAFGAKEYQRLGKILKHNVVLGMLIATLFVALMLGFQSQIMQFMSEDSQTYLASIMYYRLVVIGLWFNCLVALIAASVRGVAETKVPMQINVLANICNMVLAYLLVYGWGFIPELGITGAGVATLSSNVIAAGFLVYYVSSGRSAIRVTWRENMGYESEIVKQILRIGLPATGEQFVLRSSIILYTKIVASLGTAYMAAHQIALNILSLSITPGMALGIAASALVGQSLGAKDADLADQYGRQCVRFSFIFGCVMSVVFLLMRDVIGALYTNEPEVIALVSIPLIWMAVMTPFQLVQLVQVGTLRGVGDTVFPMLSTGISVLFIRVCLSYLFVNVFRWGLAGAWQAVVCDQLVRSILINWRYRQGKWKTLEL